MRVIELKVYQFDELSDAAKERARAWYRDASAGDNFFAKSVIEDAATVAALLGLDIRQRPVRLMGGGTRLEPAVYWSGFWSQGDGACCEGEWRADAVKRAELKDYAPQDKELHRIADEFARIATEWPDARFTVKHRGHYSHENCTEFDFAGFNREDADGSFRELSPAEEDAANTAGEDLTEAARDFMRWIYRQLEKAYEYENADEQVDEFIRANEYEFDEEGSRA